VNRITITCSCELKLLRFPMDVQQCSATFSSYAYNTKELIIKWKTGNKNSVQENFHMAEFDLIESSFKDQKLTYSSGNFSTLTMTLTFERNFGYYLIQIYIPDIIVVSLSWIVFWMESQDFGNRMALGVTTLLTVIFLLGSTRYI